MSTLINPALVAAANPHGGPQSSAARKSNAEAYVAAMRDAGAATMPPKDSPAPVVSAAFAREAPFGAEQPRYQRPGAVVDLRV